MAPPEEQGMRVRGLFVLAALVILGVGVTAGYLQWKAPELSAIVAERRGAVASAPRAPHERLAKWLVFGDAFVHERLTQMRYSAEHPWLVAFAVGDAGDALFTGIDIGAMPKSLTRAEGLTVHVTLPAPVELGRTALTGDRAPFVPLHPDSTRAPNAEGARARVQEVVEWALKDIAKALARDIEGARLVVEVGPHTAFPADRAPSPDTAGESGG